MLMIMDGIYLKSNDINLMKSDEKGLDWQIIVQYEKIFYKLLIIINLRLLILDLRKPAKIQTLS